MESCCRDFQYLRRLRALERGLLPSAPRSRPKLMACVSFSIQATSCICEKPDLWFCLFSTLFSYFISSHHLVLLYCIRFFKRHLSLFGAGQIISKINSLITERWRECLSVSRMLERLFWGVAVCFLTSRSPILCDPVGCSPAKSLCPWIAAGTLEVTHASSRASSQPDRTLTSHSRRVLYHLNHQEAQGSRMLSAS